MVSFRRHLDLEFTMFKRPHSSKTSAPLRSSDARKLREELQTAFVLSPALAKALLPDGLLVQKATNHLEEPLTIYSAPNGDPRFFRPGKGNDGALIPTCYTFDLVPELLPVLVTAPQVVENLVSGAGTLRCSYYASSARMTSANALSPSQPCSRRESVRAPCGSYQIPCSKDTSSQSVQTAPSSPLVNLQRIGRISSPPMERGRLLLL